MLIFEVQEVIHIDKNRQHNSMCEPDEGDFIIRVNNSDE